MPTLGQTQYYRTMVNGFPNYTSMPWGGNVPYGYEPLTSDQYIEGLKERVQTAKNFMDTYEGPAYAKRPKDTTNWNGMYYSGPTWDQKAVDSLNNEIKKVESESGTHSADYVAPGFEKFMPNAPTPSEQYYTKEFKATLAPSEQRRLNQLYGQNDTIAPAPAGMAEVKIGNSYALMDKNSEGYKNYINPAPNQPTGVSQPNYSQGAKDLAKQMLTTTGGNMTNLQKNPAWADSPYKNEAWSMIKDIQSSPQALADMVKTLGITDLQNYAWWDTNPNKVEAWKLIQGTAPTAGPSGTSNMPNAPTAGEQNPPGTTTPTAGQSNGTMTTVPPTTGPVPPAPNGDKSYLDIINNSDLDEGTKSLFRQLAIGWDPKQEASTANVISKFKEIQRSTIDPHFQELSKIYIDSLARVASNNAALRNAEVEREKADALALTRRTQGSLQNRGMTFSSDATDLLGNKSAYGDQVPFGGPTPEGTVNAENRLIATSSAARYQNNLTDLQRQAEVKLGSKDVIPFNGVDPLGGITGTLNEDRNVAYADTLSALQEQNKQNQTANAPITPYA